MNLRRLPLAYANTGSGDAGESRRNNFLNNRAIDAGNDEPRSWNNVDKAPKRDLERV